MEPNQEFPYWKRNLVLAWISQFFVLAGFAAAMTFIPLFFQDHLGIESENERGIYVSMFNFFGVLGYAVFCPLWGSLSDRFGVKIMLLRGSFVTAIFFPMMAFVTAPWQLITLRLVTAALAGTTAACHILLAKGTPDDKQGFAQGSLTAAVCAGSLVGNMVGGFFVDFYGYTFTFVACGVLYVLSGIFCLFMKEKKIVRVQGESAYVKKIRNYRKSPMPQFTIGVWLMLLLYSLSSLVGYLSVPYVAMMIELIDTTGRPAYWTGIICSISSVCALFSGLIFGYLADHVKPKYLIIPVLSVIGLCLIIRGVADSLFVFGLFSAFASLVGSGLAPLNLKTLAAATPPRKRGAVFGWSATFSNSGNMLSTVISGWIVFTFGTKYTYIISGICMFLMIPITMYIYYRIMHQPYFLAHAEKVFNKKK